MEIKGEFNPSVRRLIDRKIRMGNIIGMYKGSLKQFSSNNYIVITDLNVIFMDSEREITVVSLDRITGFKHFPGNYYGKVIFFADDQDYEFSEVRMFVFEEMVNILKSYLHGRIIKKSEFESRNIFEKLKQQLADGKISVELFDKKVKRISASFTSTIGYSEKKMHSCTNCLTENISSSKFCIHCGISL